MANLFSFETKIKLLLHKRYFEMGYGLTQYLKYFIVLFGFTTQNWNWSAIFLVVYGFACYAIGWAFIHSGFYRADAEVNNRFNPFVDEMRKHINRKHKV